MIGETISHYKILSRLGEGGMGMVFKAEDLRLKRTVALKFLPPELTQDSDAKKRFSREARTASALDHPNICTIYDVNETEDGQMFIVMAYYPGVTLKEKIKRGPLMLDEAIDIACSIAQGLEGAREAGITHRDIKSANIMITDRGEVKILDFGLAKLAGQSGIMSAEATLGTVAYISPEQALGRDVDHRTDLWSLGVVLYEMVTGELPFKGGTVVSHIYSIINESPLPPSELKPDTPADLEKIIFKCLAKIPEDRYGSAEQLLTDLTACAEITGEEIEDSTPEEELEQLTRKETERRQATVLSAEISGYAEMLGRMEPEEVASIMSHCFSDIVRIIEKYGGSKDLISGNILRALFGIPEALERAPRQAVSAAIEIRNSVRELQQELGLGFALGIRIGINSGLVITGVMDLDDSSDHSVMGDSVDLATHLMESASHGQILVGPETHRLTRDEFHYQELKSIALKGRKESIQSCELLSHREKIAPADLTVLDVDRMVFSEMIGREAELRRLELRLHKVIEGEGSIVNVIGEAGIGKSRLITEFRASEAISQVTVLEGRALSIGRNLSYHPVIDILKSWADIKERDTEQEAYTKLEAAVREIHPESASEIFPFIATLMGMKLSGGYAERVNEIMGESLEKLILNNLRMLISKGSELRPLVFIIEDLHWADMSTLNLLEYLYRLAESHPILFINVFRPNYKETSERIRETVRVRYSSHSLEIYLEHLTDEQSHALLHNLLKEMELPADIRRAISKRTEGNPFFIEEIIRSLVDEGTIALINGEFRISEQLDSVIIPGTIQEVIMARIDRLDADTRALLKVASVIGRHFFYKILAGVAEIVDKSDLDDRLEYLKGIQLIRESSRKKELEYLFQHALAQETVYNSILANKRKALHINVALSIESIFRERLHEFYGMLAFHYSMGEDLDRAEEYLIMAGEEALKSSASSEALHYYQEALRIYLVKHGEAADPEKIATLQKNIGHAFFNKGQLYEAVEYFDGALVLYGEKLPRTKVTILAKFMAGLLFFLKSLYSPFLTRKRSPSDRDREIISVYERKIRALSTVDPRRMFVESFYWVKRLVRSHLHEIDNGVGLFAMLSGLFSFSGMSFGISRRILKAAADQLDETEVKSLIYFRFSELLHQLLAGEWNRIRKFDASIVDQGLRIGEIWGTTGYTLFHGHLAGKRGNHLELHATLDKLQESSNLYEDEFSKTTSYLMSTYYYSLYRKLDESMKEADEAGKFFDDIGYNNYACETYAYKAHALMLSGDIDEAEQYLQIAENRRINSNIVPVTLMRYLHVRHTFSIYRLEQSLIHGDRTQYKKYRSIARKEGRRTARISRKVLYERVATERLLGTFCWLLNRQKKALNHWMKSIRYGESIGYKVELSRTYMEIGKRLTEESSRFRTLNGKDGNDYLDSARKLFLEIGLEWDLGALDELAQR